MGTESQFGKMEKVLEMMVQRLHNNMNILNTTQLYI